MGAVLSWQLSRLTGIQYIEEGNLSMSLTNGRPAVGLGLTCDENAR